MSPMPAVPDFTTEVYSQQHMFNASDEANGWNLLLLNDAFCAPFIGVDELVRDDETAGTTGWEKLYDPDLVPIEHLGYLAAFVGVRLLPGLPEAAQRERVKATDGFNRGTPAAIKAAAAQFLTGAKTAIVRERYGSAYRLHIITYTSQTPDPAATLAALKAQKPAGIVMTYQVNDGQDLQSLSNGHATLQDINNHYATLQAIADDQPTL